MNYNSLTITTGLSNCLLGFITLYRYAAVKPYQICSDGDPSCLKLLETLI